MKPNLPSVIHRIIFSLLAGAALSNWVSLPARAASFDTCAAALSSRRFLRARTLPEWGSNRFRSASRTSTAPLLVKRRRLGGHALTSGAKNNKHYEKLKTPRWQVAPPSQLPAPALPGRSAPSVEPDRFDESAPGNSNSRSHSSACHLDVH